MITDSRKRAASVRRSGTASRRASSPAVASDELRQRGESWTIRSRAIASRHDRAVLQPDRAAASLRERKLRARTTSPRRDHVRGVAGSRWAAWFAGDDAWIPCGASAEQQGAPLPSRSAESGGDRRRHAGCWRRAARPAAAGTHRGPLARWSADPGSALAWRSRSRSAAGIAARPPRPGLATDGKGRRGLAAPPVSSSYPSAGWHVSMKPRWLCASGLTSALPRPGLLAGPEASCPTELGASCDAS